MSLDTITATPSTPATMMTPTTPTTEATQTIQRSTYHYILSTGEVILFSVTGGIVFLFFFCGIIGILCEKWVQMKAAQRRMNGRLEYELYP